MSTAPVPVIAKVSFLKRFGQIVGKILHVIAKSAAPIADQAASVAEVLLPQFAPEIAFADSLVTKIAKQAIITEAITTGVGAAASGADKLAMVLAGVGPEVDAWVTAMFPGAKQVSAIAKAGLVNAVVAITNELQPAAAVSSQAAV